MQEMSAWLLRVMRAMAIEDGKLHKKVKTQQDTCQLALKHCVLCEGSQSECEGEVTLTIASQGLLHPHVIGGLIHL